MEVYCLEYLFDASALGEQCLCRNFLLYQYLMSKLLLCTSTNEYPTHSNI